MAGYPDYSPPSSGGGGGELDADLATIAGLTATTDSFIQAKSSAWAARTIAQVAADLGLSTTRSTVSGSFYGGSGVASTTTFTSQWYVRGLIVYLPAGTYDRVDLVTTIAGTQTLAMGIYPVGPTGYPTVGTAPVVNVGNYDMSVTAGLLSKSISWTIATGGLYAIVGSTTAYTSTATIRSVSAYSADVRSVPQGVPVLGMATSVNGGSLSAVESSYLASFTAGVDNYPSGLNLSYNIPKYQIRAA